MFHSTRAFATVAVFGAAALLAGCAGGPGGAASSPDPTFDPNEKVTLDFAFWGNDVRAELYNEAIAAFNEEYPNITVNPTFLAWDEYWEKRQTEAAGGGLPDVLATDINYLRQYGQNGLLLDLNPYFGNVIDTEPLPETVLGIGVVDDATVGLPVSTNALGLFQNPTLADEVGTDEFPGGDWDDFDAWLADVRDDATSSSMEVWGSSNPYGFIQTFEIYMRSQGEDLFSQDGEPQFDEADLTEFWDRGTPLIEDDLVIPQQRLEEVAPKSGFDSGHQIAEITWDNFGAGYLANLGDAYPTLDLVAPPVTKEGAKDLYMKAGQLLSAAASTEHPEAAATFVDYLVNSPDVAAIFGTNRGLPASESALEGLPKDEAAQQILDYEASIQDRIGDAPPVPIVGYGSLEAKFKELGQEIGFGTVTVDDAVAQFFAEMDVILNQ